MIIDQNLNNKSDNDPNHQDINHNPQQQPPPPVALVSKRLSIKIVLAVGFMIYLFVAGNGNVGFIGWGTTKAVNHASTVLAHQVSGSVVNSIQSGLRDGANVLLSLRNFTRTMGNFSSPFSALNGTDERSLLNMFLATLTVMSTGSLDVGSSELWYRAAGDGAFAIVTSNKTVFSQSSSSEDGNYGRYDSNQNVVLSVQVCRSYNGILNTSSSSSSSSSITNFGKDIPFDCFIDSFYEKSLEKISSSSSNNNVTFNSQEITTLDSTTFVNGEKWKSFNITNYYSNTTSTAENDDDNNEASQFQVSLSYHRRTSPSNPRLLIREGIQINFMSLVFPSSSSLSNSPYRQDPLGLFCVSELTEERLKSVLFDALPRAPDARAFLIQQQQNSLNHNNNNNYNNQVVIVSSHDPTFTVINRTGARIPPNQAAWQNCFLAENPDSQQGQMMACLFNISTHPEYAYLRIPGVEGLEDSSTTTVTDDTNQGNGGAGRTFLVIRRSMDMRTMFSISSSSSSSSNSSSPFFTLKLIVFIPIDFYTYDTMVRAMITLGISMALPSAGALFSVLIIRAVSARMTSIAAHMQDPFSEKQVEKSEKRQKRRRERQRKIRYLNKELAKISAIGEASGKRKLEVENNSANNIFPTTNNAEKRLEIMEKIEKIQQDDENDFFILDDDERDEDFTNYYQDGMDDDNNSNNGNVQPRKKSGPEMPKNNGKSANAKSWFEKLLPQLEELASLEKAFSDFRDMILLLRGFMEKSSLKRNKGHEREDQHQHHHQQQKTISDEFDSILSSNIIRVEGGRKLQANTRQSQNNEKEKGEENLPSTNSATTTSANESREVTDADDEDENEKANEFDDLAMPQAAVAVVARAAASASLTSSTTSPATSLKPRGQSMSTNASFAATAHQNQSLLSANMIIPPPVIGSNDFGIIIPSVRQKDAENKHENNNSNEAKLNSPLKGSNSATVDTIAVTSSKNINNPRTRSGAMPVAENDNYIDSIIVGRDNSKEEEPKSEIQTSGGNKSTKKKVGFNEEKSPTVKDDGNIVDQFDQEKNAKAQDNNGSDDKKSTTKTAESGNEKKLNSSNTASATKNAKQISLQRSISSSSFLAQQKFRFSAGANLRVKIQQQQRPSAISSLGKNSSEDGEEDNDIDDEQSPMPRLFPVVRNSTSATLLLGDYFTEKMLVCALNLRGTHQLMDQVFKISSCSSSDVGFATKSDHADKNNNHCSPAIPSSFSPSSSSSFYSASELFMKRTTAIVEKLSQVIDSCGGNLIEFRGDHFFVCVKISRRLPSKLGRRFVGRLVNVGTFIKVLDELLAFEWFRRFSRQSNNTDNNEHEQSGLNSGSYLSNNGDGSRSKSDLERDLRMLLQLSEKSLQSLKMNNSNGGDDDDDHDNSFSPRRDPLLSYRGSSNNTKSETKSETQKNLSDSSRPPVKNESNNDNNNDNNESNESSNENNNIGDPFEFVFSNGILQKISREIANSHKNQSGVGVHKVHQDKAVTFLTQKSLSNSYGNNSAADSGASVGDATTLHSAKNGFVERSNVEKTPTSSINSSASSRLSLYPSYTSSSALVTAGFAAGNARSLYMYSDGNSIARPTSFFGPCFSQALEIERKVRVEHLSDVVRTLHDLFATRKNLVAEIEQLQGSNEQQEPSSKSMVDGDHEKSNGSGWNSNSTSRTKENKFANVNDDGDAVAAKMARRVELQFQLSKVEQSLLSLRLLQQLPFAFGFCVQSTAASLEVPFRKIGKQVINKNDDDDNDGGAHEASLKFGFVRPRRNKNYLVQNNILTKPRTYETIARIVPSILSDAFESANAGKTETATTTRPIGHNNNNKDKDDKKNDAGQSKKNRRTNKKHRAPSATVNVNDNNSNNDPSSNQQPTQAMSLKGTNPTAGGFATVEENLFDE